MSKKKLVKVVADVLTPVNRIDMSYKDVTARVPELTEAARRVQAGRMTQSEYAALVNALKPVKPYEFIPKPATVDEAIAALTSNKRGAYGKTADIGAGEMTDLRLDIPAYSQHGVWVNSIHRKGAPTVYGATSSVTDATMIPSPEKAMKVATGETSKAPFAVIRGGWNPMDEAFVVEQAQKYLKHKDWRQVGYDPERHGYFYDRETMSPIVSADEVIQIGPLVLAKKPKYGDPEDFPFRKGGAVNKKIDEIIAQAKQGPVSGYAPLRTRTPSQYEKDFDQYLAAQQEARQRLLTDRIPKSIDDAIAKAAGLVEGGAGALFGYGAQLPGMVGDLRELYEEYKPEGWADAPEWLKRTLTTEQIQDLLTQNLIPPEIATENFKAGTTGGNIAAIAEGVASLPQAAKVIGAGVGKGVRALAPTANQMLENYMLRTGMALPVVKRKGEGGNWLTGSVEDALGAIKPRGPTHRDEALGDWTRYVDTPEGQRQIVQNDALSQFIDKQLTRYIKNEMGAPEDPVRLAADAFPATKAQMLADKQKQIDKAVADMEKARAVRNFTPEMMTSSQARIRELQKEKELLELRMGLHFDAPRVEPTHRTDAKRNAFAAKNEGKWGYGQSPIAQNWEDAADAMINVVPAESFQSLSNRNYMQSNPQLAWIDKLSPDASIYGLNRGVTGRGGNDPSIESLGFPHLIDELRNATNPESGLPRNLLINSKDLPKLTVPQAIEHVDKINAWRAVQRQEAAKAVREGIPVHKEYPEGYQWLSVPDLATDEKALRYATDIGCEGGWCTQGEETAKMYGGGGNRLFVLHDPKGKPVVQIQVQPNKTLPRWDEVTPYLQAAEEEAKKLPNGYTSQDVSDIATKMATEKMPSSIGQIKGILNKPPKPEYLPFVQDFVRSGQWSDVGDIQNANMVRIYPDSDLAAKMKAAGKEPPTYVSQDEFTQLSKENPMKRGGAVHIGPISLDAMRLAVDRKAKGGVMGAADLVGKGIKLGKEMKAAAAAREGVPDLPPGMGGWMKGVSRTAEEAKRLYDIAKGTRSKAAQEAAGLYHPIGGGIKLSKPIDLMQFETVKDPTVEGVQRKIITPEDMQGGIGIPLVGDRAAGGTLLTSVEGIPFRSPLTLEAGPDYMLTHTIPGSPESSIWRSGQGVITGLQKQVEFARDMGRPIYGVNVVGAPTMVNYNTMVTEAILNQYDPAALTKKAKKEFLKDIRNYAPDPDKPHLKPGSVLTEADLNDVEALRAKMLAEGAGPLRKAFVERMALEPFQKMGFPDVPASRLATTEPLLVDVPTGSAGFTVGTIDPAARALEQTPRGHKSYSVALAGEYLGSLGQPIDYRNVFQGFADKRRLDGKPEGSDWRSFSIRPQIQTFDQEWLDRVMKSAGADKPREWKSGGPVEKADSGAVKKKAAGGLTSDDLVVAERKL